MKIYNFVILLTCLVVLIGAVSSRKIKVDSEAKGTQHINEKCEKDSDCVGDLICVAAYIKPDCDKDTCKFEKVKSVCRVKPNEDCTQDDHCASNKCDNKRKCSDYKRKFLEECKYSYIWNECEQNTYCTITNNNSYKCLGGPNHKCEKDSECYNQRCGVGIGGACLNLAEKVMRDTVGYMFSGVTMKNTLGIKTKK
jgi:hypothetical protein